MTEILLVDATEELQMLARELESEGCRLTACTLAEAGMQLAGDRRFEAMLLNLTDGGIGAPALASLLRTDTLPDRTAAIAVLRAEQVAELDSQLPLDDFVVHPVAVKELLARIGRASWRRAGDEDSQVVHAGDVIIDQATYKVMVRNRQVELTYKEYELLRFLVLNQDRVCTRETLLNRVWGYDFYGGARTVDVHIRRLRSKIEDGSHMLIETVRNVGYRFHPG